MIYKQKNNIEATEHFLEDFLRERNIKDLQTFLHPTVNELHDFMLLDNIVTAAHCLLNHIDKDSKIFFKTAR